MSAGVGCYHQPGKTLTNHILTLDPTELSSMVTWVGSTCKVNSLFIDGKFVSSTDCGNDRSIIARPFTLADLQGPLPPRAAFFGGKLDDMDQSANFIIENRYFPDIVLPNQVTELEPLWASCSPFGDASGTFKSRNHLGVWDPPMTLAGTISLAAASIPAHRGKNDAQITQTPLPGPMPARPNGLVPTKATQSNRQVLQTWVPPNPMVAGAGARSSARPGSASINQVESNMPRVLGISGLDPSTWTDAAGSVHSAGTASTRTTRQESGAGRLSNSIRNAMFLCELMIGLISMSFAC
jgi:hypothetical protein